MLRHTVQKLGDAWTHQNVNLANVTLDFDWQHDVWVLNLFELRMHQSFIEVKHQCLFANLRFSLRPNEPLLVLSGLLLLLTLPRLLLELLILSLDRCVLLNLGDETRRHVVRALVVVLLLPLLILQVLSLLLEPCLLIIHT